MTVLQENRRPYDFFKRGLDIVISLLGLLLLWPVMAVTAVLVWVKLGRPVIFRQPRPGKDAQVFTLYKFRSMKDVDEARDLLTDTWRVQRNHAVHGISKLEHFSGLSGPERLALVRESAELGLKLAERWSREAKAHKM